MLMYNIAFWTCMAEMNPLEGNYVVFQQRGETDLTITGYMKPFIGYMKDGCVYEVSLYKDIPLDWNPDTYRDLYWMSIPTLPQDE